MSKRIYISPIHLINLNDNKMSCVIFLGRGIGMLVASYIYIVIQQRLLFLVFAILNIIAAVIYSIYFLLTRKKPSSNNVTISNTNDLSIPTGSFLFIKKNT